MKFYQIPLIAILFSIGVLGLILSDAETGDAADGFTNFNYGDTLLIAWSVNRSSLYNIYLVSCPGITPSSPGARLGCTTNDNNAAMSLFNTSTCYNLKNANITVPASSRCDYSLTDDSNYGNATAVLEGDFNSLGSTHIAAQIQAEFIVDEDSIAFMDVSLPFAFEWNPPMSASSSNLAAITSLPARTVSSTITTTKTITVISKGSSLSAAPTLPPTTNSLTTITYLSLPTTSSPSSIQGPSSDSISLLPTPASWYITATSSIIEESSTSTADAAASSNYAISLSKATTAGIITGVSLGALALAALLFYLWRRKQRNAMEKSNGMGISGGLGLTTGNDIQEVSGVEKSSGQMPAELDGGQVLRT